MEGFVAGDAWPRSADAPCSCSAASISSFMPMVRPFIRQAAAGLSSTSRRTAWSSHRVVEGRAAAFLGSPDAAAGAAPCWAVRPTPGREILLQPLEQQTASAKSMSKPAPLSWTQYRLARRAGPGEERDTRLLLRAVFPGIAERGPLHHEQTDRLGHDAGDDDFHDAARLALAQVVGDGQRPADRSPGDRRSGTLRQVVHGVDQLAMPRPRRPLQIIPAGVVELRVVLSRAY